MKKIISLLLVLLMVFSLVACNQDPDENDDDDNKTDIHEKGEGVMTYEQYAAAAIDAEVVIEAFVQGKQSWWDNKATIYLQDKDGAYFVYEMAISEADYNKLENGTKVKVSGYKAEWAGEVEIVDATFEILDGKYVATATDLTDKIADEAELLKRQNMFAAFGGLVVEDISYKNGEPGDDIYLTLSKDGANYSFCIERYLTAPDTDVYKLVATLKAGDVIDVEGFLYWYNGMNPHVTSIKKTGSVNEKSAGVMTHAEYAAAAIDDEVVIEAYVQATQSWWDNKITVYLADVDGAYFAYEMACSEEDAAKLVPGAKIKVTGYKAAWSGEVEIVDATFELQSGSYIAPAMDATDIIADSDALLAHQNELVSFKGLTVTAIEYKNGEPGDDIYLTLSKDGADYSFCIERYLTAPDTDVYKFVATLKAGDVIDVEGFLYWYNGMNPHVTSIVKK